jgi:hypothetical protein
MGIAGSSALLLLEAILKKGYTYPTEYGRWSTQKELWPCNDVDLFVLRDVNYGEFVEVFIPVLSSVAENFGYAAYNEREVLFPTREVGLYRRMN